MAQVARFLYWNNCALFYLFYCSQITLPWTLCILILWLLSHQVRGKPDNLWHIGELWHLYHWCRQLSEAHSLVMSWLILGDVMSHSWFHVSLVMSPLKKDVVNNNQFNGYRSSHYGELYSEVLMGWHRDLVTQIPSIDERVNEWPFELTSTCLRIVFQSRREFLSNDYTGNTACVSCFGLLVLRGVPLVHIWMETATHVYTNDLYREESS